MKNENLLANSNYNLKPLRCNSWEKRVAKQNFGLSKCNFTLYDFKNHVKLFCGDDSPWNNCYICLIKAVAGDEYFKSDDCKNILSFSIEYMEAEDEEDESYWYIKGKSDLNINFDFIKGFFPKVEKYRAISGDVYAINDGKLRTEDKLQIVRSRFIRQLKKYILNHPNYFII